MKRLLKLTILFPLILGGCAAKISDGDQKACDLAVELDRSINEQAHNVSQLDDDDKLMQQQNLDTTLESAPSVLTRAADQADTPRLSAALLGLRTASQERLDGEHPAHFSQQMHNVWDICQSLHHSPAEHP